jgi:hypothetical protein
MNKYKRQSQLLLHDEPEELCDVRRERGTYVLIDVCSVFLALHAHSDQGLTDCGTANAIAVGLGLLSR